AAGASAALTISDIPFNGPSAAVRMGRVKGQYVVCPSREVLELGESDLEVLVAGSEKAILMVEGGAQEVPESDLLDAVLKGHEEIKKICKVIKDLQSQSGKEKRPFTAPTLPADIEASVKKLVESDL